MGDAGGPWRWEMGAPGVLLCLSPGAGREAAEGGKGSRPFLYLHQGTEPWLKMGKDLPPQGKLRTGEPQTRHDWGSRKKFPTRAIGAAL